MSVYSYRCLIRSRKGICIKINAQYWRYSTSNYLDVSEHISDGVYLYVGHAKCNQIDRLSEEVIMHLKYGLSLVSLKINENSKFTNDTLIILNEINYTLCDFQVEGITDAIMGWSSEQFEFKKPRVVCTFNKDKDRYEFDFETIF